MNIINIPSPHRSSGRRKFRPEAIVIHIMEGTLAGTDSWFRDARSKVSAHYGIGKNGDVHQYVAETDTAWHAGRVNAPSWSLIKSAGHNLFINPNFYTIGIEHEGKEDTDWTEEMYQASAALIKDISNRWGIPVDRTHIIGHHEIYSLKTCPGLKVDLNKLISLAGGSKNASADASISAVIKVAEKGKVTTKSRMNIRPQPNTTLKPVNTLERNVQLAYDGYTEEGEKINGNGKWYFTNEGSWFWSGAVTSIVDIPVNAIDVSIEGIDLTIEQIKEATRAKTVYAMKFAPFIADTCKRFQINTPVRKLCFLAQVGHESGGLFYTEELASGRRYEKRRDLGNIREGDGPRYKGRGLIQITGRTNYTAISHFLNEDFIGDPKKLGGKNVKRCTDEQLKNAALSAGWFWNKVGLNVIADQIDIQKPIDKGANLKQFRMLTRKINGGFNGLADRIERYKSGVTFFV